MYKLCQTFTLIVLQYFEPGIPLCCSGGGGGEVAKGRKDCALMAEEGLVHSHLRWRKRRGVAVTSPTMHMWN